MKSITVCTLRNAGIFNNVMVFNDDYINNFNIRERAHIINTLRTVMTKMSPERFLSQYTSHSIFPYGPLVMLVRDNQEILNEIRKQLIN